ncbi:ATP-binding cassette domain-containing protein [Sinorhizobium meliloti]|uniref:ABC transporter ATP-binding protein n=1 Tax=Rhizobium meliloti TaxID=382 RepID=UPI001295E09C|nr:ABC transporter ATP-binding protein [Sinorhizobium meliloti]MQW13076.1 ATP-binding cassette domain-containing protein [Sinorhizobium meliloti]
MENLLSVQNLTKRFGAVIANDGVSLDIRKGEIHCLFGENGAGKSTLSACLYGYYRADAGEIRFKGNVVQLNSPADALRLGIGMVHQHFVLVSNFTVLENIIVGSADVGIFLSLQEARCKVRELCASCGIQIDLDRELWQLSVGEQQWVEILKALYLGAELLILDEPTAVLTPQQSDQLFTILDGMRRQGLSIILISHKLREVMQSDRVTILRKGKVVATVDTAGTTAEAVTALMVGHKVTKRRRDKSVRPGREILRVDRACAFGDWGEEVLNDVTLTIAAGELLGIAGVAGNGQKELFEAVMGVRELGSGTLSLDGQAIGAPSAREMLDRGVGLVPDDRFLEGLIPEFGTAENLILGWQRSPEYRRGPFLNRRKIKALAERKIEEFKVVTASCDLPVERLSGGNAQRVILAREFLHAKGLLLANQPTRGLDVAASEFVYERILEKRAAGFAVLLASEELDDLLRLCDRIAVMFKGRVMGIVRPEETTLLELGMMMAGDARNFGGEDNDFSSKALRL